MWWDFVVKERGKLIIQIYGVFLRAILIKEIFGVTIFIHKPYG